MSMLALAIKRANFREGSEPVVENTNSTATADDTAIRIHGSRVEAPADPQTILITHGPSILAKLTS